MIPQFINSQDFAIASEKKQNRNNQKYPHWLKPKGEFLGLCN